MAENTQETYSEFTISIPEGLHPDTKELVASFAEALAAKLRESEKKYGYNNAWKARGWFDSCRTQLLSHLYKGDPRDVAAYAAFLWHHKEPTFIKENN